MRRKVFFRGEYIKLARVKVLDVIPQPEGASHDRIRYLVRCDQCGEQRTMAHSTLRQRIADRNLACGPCSKKRRDYNIVPPAWPVPPMVLEELRRVE